MSNIISPDTDYTAFNPVIKVDVKKPVTDEIASAASDTYNFQAFLPIMENPDEVLNLEAGGDITIYDKIGSDPRAAANLRTRAKAVVGREWQVVPFSQETIDLKIAEYVTEVFSKFPYDLARRPVLRGGVLKGFSVSEIMWDSSEGDTFITDMRYRHQRRFKFAPKGDLHLLTIDNPYPGINATRDESTGLLLKKFQIFTFGDEVTTPYGNGIGKELYWPWFFKRSDIKFWVMFADKFAAPTVVGEYPSGTDQGKQQTLLAAAASVHSNSSVVFPQGMSLRLLEAARSGSVSCYKELHDTMNDEMTICILGQLATTGGQPGKLGDSQEQEAVYEDYIKDDADSLCEAQNDRTNGVIPWLVDYQFPGHGRYPRIEIKCGDEESGLTLAQRDNELSQSLTASGLKLTKSYYIKTHTMEESDIEEVQPDKPSTSPASSKSLPGNPAEFAEHACPHCGGLDFADASDPDAVDQLAEQALDQADGSALVAAIYRHIAQAKDLADALNTLPSRQTGPLDIRPIADALAKACVVARFTGRSEVLDEVAADGVKFSEGSWFGKIKKRLERVATFFSGPQFAEGTPLPFDQAISFFRQKLNVKTETWTDMWKGEHSRQFTVAGVMRDDMLNDFRSAIETALTDGTTHKQFLGDFDAIVEKYGWSYNGGRGWRSKVIYNTNVRTAYNAGRWEQLTDPDLLSLNPYLEYRHGDSRNPRPLHLSWNGKVLPANDPWWKTHYTPNGWGCKCRVLSAGKRDLEAAGKSGPDQAPDDGTYEWADKKTGEVHEIPRGIDPGWDYNPGEQWLNPGTGKLEPLK